MMTEDTHSEPSRDFTGHNALCPPLSLVIANAEPSALATSDCKCYVLVNMPEVFGANFLLTTSFIFTTRDRRLFSF